MSVLGDTGHASAENGSVFRPFYDRTSDEMGRLHRNSETQRTSVRKLSLSSVITKVLYRGGVICFYPKMGQVVDRPEVGDICS